VRIELTDRQKENRSAFRKFVDEAVIPYAAENDRQERMPVEDIHRIARLGYLGAVLPEAVGGAGMDMISFGLLNEELGRGCSSLRSLLTVHSMAAVAIQRWGSKVQKEEWLPRLAGGEKIGAFALTEPNVGSDAKNIETAARTEGDEYVLNGEKRWITFGQMADLFLVFAKCEGQPAALLVERETPGLSIRPVSGMLGVRASMLAELCLRDCRIPKGNLVGRLGFGLSHVAAAALDCGRYSVAWGTVGIAQACLEASLRYTNRRKQFGNYLKEHQLVRQMISEMITNVEAARLLCYQAGYLKDKGDPAAIIQTSMAKYFASRTASKASIDAVQLHGANGCSSSYPVERYLRDARIMEIIEGSTQIQQLTIADYGYQQQRQ
jgi:hypothetical protein